MITITVQHYRKQSTTSFPTNRHRFFSPESSTFPMVTHRRIKSNSKIGIYHMRSSQLPSPFLPVIRAVSLSSLYKRKQLPGNHLSFGRCTPFQVFVSVESPFYNIIPSIITDHAVRRCVSYHQPSASHYGVRSMIAFRLPSFSA